MLGLVLAERRIAIRWLSGEPPAVGEWLNYIMEWAVAEEIHKKQIRKDVKLEDDLRAWDAMLDDLKDPPNTGPPRAARRRYELHTTSLHKTRLGQSEREH